MRQIDFVLEKPDLTRLNCELAVKVHAWLMRQVSEEYSKLMHMSDDLRPFSLFARVQKNNIALRLSLLHEDAAPLFDAVKSARSIAISWLRNGIMIENRIEKPAVTIGKLRGPAPKEFRIILASPASYRHNRRPSNLYSLPPLLYTAAAKLRKYEGIDISNEEVFTLCDLVTYTRYELRTAEYRIKPGIARPGFEGKLTLCPGGDQEQRDRLALLVRYSAYAGVGAKTALGMGGILIVE
ncbi:MAG: CRISPR system precrRNA processing endoribonuclease RAMP protein Cas6 [Clostridiales bacterium]|jgi:CRISPR-associated endoribonuclease Cas6|nr:CRISPR system precrRNA processing endoribonuclease RAMP protein Cas6 [Clostridiales bacterium]